MWKPGSLLGHHGLQRFSRDDDGDILNSRRVKREVLGFGSLSERAKRVQLGLTH